MREGMVGRGDFLVMDGDRAPFCLTVSVAFGVMAALGMSTLLGLSVEVFGLVPQANLILHSRFGASAVGTVAGTAVGSGAGGAGGAAGLTTGSFLPPHAKLIHRFLGGASTGGLVVGDTLTAPTISGLMGFVGSDLTTGIVGGNGAFAANE